MTQRQSPISPYVESLKIIRHIDSLTGEVIEIDLNPNLSVRL